MRCLSTLRFRSVKRYLKPFVVIIILVTSVNVIFTFAKLNFVKYPKALLHVEPAQQMRGGFVKGPMNRNYTNTINMKMILRKTTYSIAREGFLSLNKTGCFTDGRVNETFALDMHDKHKVNVCVSDSIDLNRPVPDTRPSGCTSLTYGENLLTTSVIVTFYDEWPSVLLRTIHSIINRTPSKWLHEIVLVDDASTMESLKDDLDAYLDLFPCGLIKMVRLHERRGLIQARLEGIANATGEVIAIFDSHMEVNHHWLEPLLAELVKNPKTVAMSTLDYINKDSLTYKFKPVTPRYCFDWRLIFYECPFPKDRPDQGEYVRPGVVSVGTGFAIRRDYFYEIGGYDNKMNIWGGENLELSWRVWLCGGQLVHVMCSRIGHLARGQPYSFPGGRNEVVQFNYKRAVEVWMEPNHRELVYSNFPIMKDMDVGDLSDRLALKDKLQCKPFSWFIENVWPNLEVLNENVTAWGRARNARTSQCLGNNGEFYYYRKEVKVSPCLPSYALQGFSITKMGLLRTQLHCVQYSPSDKEVDKGPYLGDCLSGTQHIWIHEKQNGFLRHKLTGLCLDLKESQAIMRDCNASRLTQKWHFDYYDH